MNHEITRNSTKRDRPENPASYCFVRLRVVSWLILSIALLCCAALTVNAQRPSRAARGRSAQARAPIVVRARAGETLAALSARFNVAVEDLAHANNISADARLVPGQQILIPVGPPLQQSSAPALPVQTNDEGDGEGDANRLRLVDGSVIEFDDAWEDAQGIWYKKGSVVSLMARSRVASIERKKEAADAKDERATAAGAQTKAKIVEVGETPQRVKEPIWIYLVGGARVEADEVTETDTGAWYKRGALSIFLDRSRIERIERERPTVSSEAANAGSWIERGWTTGNQGLDDMIRTNGKRYGVDPYLIFCVMEQESRFNPRVVSPKGARGLMQLMPGTAARFGVRNSFDPMQNIMGGTLYLKQLLEQFGGRVDLVLASYNAGEGAVMKYGGNVPPYRETRDYVRRIGARYGQQNSLVQSTAMTSTARAGQK